MSEKNAVFGVAVRHGVESGEETKVQVGKDEG